MPTAGEISEVESDVKMKHRYSTPRTEPTWTAAAGYLTMALMIGGALLGAVALTASTTGSRLGVYTRDVASLAADAGVTLPMFAGAVSLLNTMLWACIASSALIAARLNPAKRTWLISFAAFVLVLAADDAVLIHESAGISEVAFFTAYGAGAVILTVAVLIPRPVAAPGSTSTRALRFGDLVLRAGPMAAAFLFGGILLAGSLVFDHLIPGPVLLEDGFKLLGALVWLTVPVLGLPNTGGRAKAASHECACDTAPTAARGSVQQAPTGSGRR